MATLKQRLHKRNTSGDYDTIHLHTTADLILMQDGTTKLSDKIASMDTAIAGKAAASHSHTNISGKAASATKLQTSRTIRANLGSTTAASFDGTANITPGVSGVLPVANGGTGVTSIAALKQALGIVDIPTTLGSTVSWAGYTWLVCHVTTSYIYMILNNIAKITRRSNSIQECSDFKSTISSANLSKLEPMSVTNGNASVASIMCEVFVPSYAQMNGGFSYFNSDSRRIAKMNGSASAYFTCTHSSAGGNYGIWYVAANGKLGGALNEDDDLGFRPCVAYKR